MYEITPDLKLDVTYDLLDGWGVPKSMEVYDKWKQWYSTSEWYRILKEQDPKLADSPFDNAVSSSKQVAAVMAALQKWKQISPATACAIANWLGGSWKWTGHRWLSTDMDKHQIGMVNPQNLISESLVCPNPVNIGEALLSLKAVSPYAHGWVVSKAIARGKRQGVNAQADVDQAQAKVLAVPLKVIHDVGKGAAAAVEGVGEGLKNAGDTVSFLSKYGIYIAMGAGALWLYWQYRKFQAVSSMTNMLKNPQQHKYRRRFAGGRPVHPLLPNPARSQKPTRC